MFSSSKKSKTIPAYDSVRTKTKNVKDKLVNSVKDVETSDWFDEERVINHAERFTYVSLILGAIIGSIALIQIVFLAKIHIIIWLLLTLAAIITISIPNAMWAGLIIASSRKHDDSMAQTVLQLIRNSVYNINVVFWFVYLICGSFAVFLVDYAKSDMDMVSSVADVSFFGPSPYALEILYFALGWNVIAGLLSIGGLVYHFVLDKNDAISIRFDNGN